MLDVDVGGEVVGPEHTVLSHLTLSTVTRMFRDTLSQLKLLYKKDERLVRGNLRQQGSNLLP